MHVFAQNTFICRSIFVFPLIFLLLFTILAFLAKSTASDSEVPTPSKRRNYDFKFKLEVVEYAEEYDNSKAARKFKIDRASVRDWTKQKPQLEDQLKASRLNSKKHANRLEGGGRKLKDGEFDEKLIYLQWIVDAWEQLPKELIVNSFEGCALTTALDGSKDDLIYSFKPDGPIPSGRAFLKETRQDKEFEAITQSLEEVDLAEDKYNGYESDESIDFENQ